MKKRFSILIPLILMVVSIVCSGLIFLQEDRENKRYIEQLALRELGLQMGLLQNILYNRLTEGDDEEAVLSLSLAAMRPGMRTLLLADAGNRVMMSNRFRWKNESAADISAYATADAFMAARSGASRLAPSPADPALLQGYFPLIVKYRRGGLEKEMGVLYVEFDIGEQLREAHRTTMEQSMLFGGISLGAALLIAVILHYLVSKRVHLLVGAARRLAAGDYTAQTRLRGEDELSELGEAFDNMAQSVALNIGLREQATLNQKRVLETALDGYWQVDREGRLVEVNDAYCRMSGYSREELLRMRVSDLEASEGTPEEVWAHIEHVVARGSDRFETLHRHKDGRLLEVEVATTYWKEADRFFVFIRDIGERKRLIRELQGEQEQLLEAQKLGEFGNWELDLVTGKLSWSQEIYAIFEIDPARSPASYEAFLNVIHPEDREKVNKAYGDSLVDRQPYHITHRLLMPDGRIKWVEERCSSTFDEAGKPLRSLGTVQDVTRRETLAEELRIAAVAFETQEAILVTDRNANIVKVNRAFEEVTGYKSEEVLGRNPRLLRSGRHDRAFYEAMWNAILRDGRWSGEVWDRRRDGGVYPKWLTITAVTNADEVTHYVAVFIDITERKKAEEEIRSLAFYDPLTRLPNRRLMLERMHLALGMSTRSAHYCALMFLDLDNFKVLNDTKGHEYGDMMLVEVARRLETCVRETDSLARFGGDEFVVLLEGLSTDQDAAVAQAGGVAEKIRDALSRPYQLRDTEHIGSPSIGVVLFKGEDKAIDELLKQADLAMYQAKEGGRNMVRFFEPSMQAVLESRTLLENALRQALPNGELELYYQVQTNRERELLGAEVLLRWHSATLGMVSPAQFIPLAEQTKLILPIGHWVLESACHQLKAWESHPVLRDMHLAVNISPVQFHQFDFVHQVKAVLAETGANPRLLELELTENLVLEDIDEATEKMGELKETGVRFSMDDFGTGYSSLQYIKRLPIDMLKIDQSFVRDILSDPGDAMMVQTISGMARNFGFDVIAEGVETQEQLSPLVERGCHQFQGYLFGKPVPLPDFEKLVGQWERG